MAQRNSFIVPLTGLMFSTGTWTLTAVSDVMKYRKTAADNSPVVRFFVDPGPEGPASRARNVKKVHVPYTVATADLDAAPTTVIRKISEDGTTRVLSDAVLTETEAKSGTDTTGLAVGDFLLSVTLATPVRLADGEYLQVEVTFDAAATSVLDIGCPRVELV
jgi:hypothetical protein